MKRAKELIKQHEGLRLQAYRCPAGVWTIGWGHTAGVKPGQYVSIDEAERLLDADIAEISAQLSALRLAVNENQRAALISFIFNVGYGAFSKSTLCKLIKADPNHPDIPAQFARWRYAGGKEIPGLMKRRAQEAALYTAP